MLRVWVTTEEGKGCPGPEPLTQQWFRILSLGLLGPIP